jgi:hypothetical protein
MGSSRSSSWIISVLSQLGIIGTLGFVFLAGVIMRGMRGLQPTADTWRVFAFAESVRASVVALLVTACLIGASADPGILFFIALAAMLACRSHVHQRRQFEPEFGRISATGRPRVTGA